MEKDNLMEFLEDRKPFIQAELDILWRELQAELEKGHEAREVVFDAMWKTGAVYISYCRAAQPTKP